MYRYMLSTVYEQLETEIRIEHISLKTGKENSDGALAFSEYRSVSEEKLS